jgi:hypothetical protein
MGMAPFLSLHIIKGQKSVKENLTAPITPFYLRMEPLNDTINES